MFAHVNIWKVNDAGAKSDNTTARELAARLREQPGFVSYTLVRTGEREVVAVTVFNSRDQLEAAVKANAGFVQQRVQPLAAGEPERRQGDVLYHTTGEAPAGDA